MLERGYPEEGDLVMCSVKEVFPYGAFVILDEYDKEGIKSHARVHGIRPKCGFWCRGKSTMQARGQRPPPICMNFRKD